MLFAEIASAGSLTAAGRALGLPKSAVSPGCRRWRSASARLLARSTRRIVSTDLGEALLVRCARLREDYAEARALLEAHAGRRGVLRVSMPTTSRSIGSANSWRNLRSAIPISGSNWTFRPAAWT